VKTIKKHVRLCTQDIRVAWTHKKKQNMTIVVDVKYSDSLLTGHDTNSVGVFEHGKG